MRRIFIVSSMVMGVLLIAGAMADEPRKAGPEAVEIPLAKVWGWNMPGTRNIGGLEPNKPPNYANGPLLAEIRRTLADLPPQGKQAKAGFAVLGTGLEALREAHAVLLGKKKPRNTFPIGSEISVVFFSYQTGSYVHLHQIAQNENVIRIYYRFVPHRTREVTDHFALIPLTELTVGKVRVEINQSTIEKEVVDGGQRPVSNEDARRIICQPFSFTIVKP